MLQPEYYYWECAVTEISLMTCFSPEIMRRMAQSD